MTLRKFSLSSTENPPLCIIFNCLAIVLFPLSPVPNFPYYNTNISNVINALH